MVDNMKRDPMGFVRKSRTAIPQNDDAKVGVGRMSRSRLDDKFGGHAH
jgi:hypothetical protein